MGPLGRLDDFEPQVRREALLELLHRPDTSFPSPRPEVNIHFHTFFSFSSAGYSPTRIAWEARKYGLEVAGIVDFDVLDGLHEFLEASELLNLKATVGLETRVYVPDYADKVITSPSEAGVHYFMAQGCYKLPEPGSAEESALKTMARTARERNLGVVERVNEYLGDIALDYARDVLPLTPSGNATERHLLLAYDRKSREALPDNASDFWASVLGMSREETRELMSNRHTFHERMRSKLIKFGGVGYVTPESGSFPAVEEVVAMARGIGAIPTTTWLDGTSAGESDIHSLLELLISKGVAAMNIIPNRNWNIENPDEKALKMAKLREAVEAARAFDLPLSIGTEMNKAGLPFVDDFSAPQLADFVDDFVRGARFFYGHTLLARWAEFGYYSSGAQAAFGGDRRTRNEFYAEVGAVAKPSQALYDRLREQAGQLGPIEILALVGRP